MLRKALPGLEANGDLGARERGFAHASVRGAQRRRLVAVGAVLALGSALVGVLALALWAQKQAKQAREQTQVAEQRLVQAVGVADLVVFKVDQQLARVAGMADLRKGLLAESMGMLDKLRKQTGASEDPALLRTRSAGHLQRGDLAMTHDNLTLAQSEYRAALQIFEALARRQPDSAQAQRDLIVSHYKLAVFYALSRQPAAARAEAGLAADLLNKLRPRLPKHDADNLDRALRALLR